MEKIKSTMDFDDRRSSQKKLTENFIDPKHLGVIYTRKTRWVMFIFFMAIYLLINMDHGTIPAATTEIKKDMGVDDDSLGIFGSLVYLGNLLGSMFFFTIIGTINRKWIIVFCLISINVSLYTFTKIKVIYYLFINRTFTGFFQAFISIYFPVWCDQYGPRNHKSLMMALLQVCVPLGVVLGYLLTFLIKNTLGWFYSFYIQIFLITFFGVALLFCPEIYFSGKHYLNLSKNHVDNAKSSEISDKTKERNDLNDDVSIFKENIKGGSKNHEIFRNMKLICGNYVFLCSVLAVSVLFFIITAIQFWVSDYLVNVLNKEQNDVTISFIITCVTSPTLGIIVGGCFFNWIGGPESKYSALYVLLLGIMAMIFSLPVPFVDNIFYFTVFLWLVLFFGGAIMPNITGIIISSLPPNIRTHGNSISNFFQNLIGYLPAPFVYGVISKYFPSQKRLPMIVIMYSSSIGVLFMTFACCFKHKTLAPKRSITERSVSKKRSMVNNLTSKTSLIALLWGNKDLEFSNIEDNNIFDNNQEEDSIKEFIVDKRINLNETMKLVIKDNNEERNKELFSSSFIEKRLDDETCKQTEFEAPKTL